MALSFLSFALCRCERGWRRGVARLANECVTSRAREASTAIISNSVGSDVRDEHGVAAMLAQPRRTRSRLASA